MLGLPEGSIRVIFWVVLGLVASAFFKFGIGVVIVTALACLAIICAMSGGGRETLIHLSRQSGRGRAHRPAGGHCLCAGRRHRGVMTLTGAATTFGQFIVGVGRTAFLSLILTMITCIIPGMGIPTIPELYHLVHRRAGALELGCR